MENKEIRNNAAELNDEALENVSGGTATVSNTIPSISRPGDAGNPYAHPVCSGCDRKCSVLKERLNSLIIHGRFYCDSCKEKLGYN